MSVASELTELVEGVVASGLTKAGIVDVESQTLGEARVIRIGPLVVSDVAATGSDGGVHRWSWWVRDEDHQVDGDLSVVVDEWDVDSAELAVSVAMWDSTRRAARTALRREVTDRRPATSDEIRDAIVHAVEILKELSGRWQTIVGRQDELAATREWVRLFGRTPTPEVGWADDVPQDPPEARRFKSLAVRHLEARWGKGVTE